MGFLFFSWMVEYYPNLVIIFVFGCCTRVPNFSLIKVYLAVFVFVRKEEKNQTETLLTHILEMAGTIYVIS